jgi:hypothetical protein
MMTEAMNGKDLANSVAKAAVMLLGVMTYVIVLHMRRYDVGTLLVRLRRLKLHDPDFGWLVAVLALSVVYALGVLAALRRNRKIIEGRRTGSPSVAICLLIAITSVLAINAVLDTYGWRVQL